MLRFHLDCTPSQAALLPDCLVSLSRSHNPHLLLLMIWRRYYLRYKDLVHCTFPSVIQGPLSLYDYIGIWYDTIYPHTPTSSTIHIGLAYVGTDRSST